MAVRRGWLGVWLVCVGCQSVPPLEKEVQEEASRQWEMGQAAMSQGRTEEAIACYEQSLASDPGFTRSHLSLAAAYLEKNNADSACTHLARYVDANPDQLPIRARYAELLLRLGRVSQARAQFEELVANSQQHPGPTGADLVHSHSRLMELAELSGDAYGEHLHRGIGLFLLARKRGTLSDADENLPAEGLLFKAAAELTLAQVQRPDEARPCWYLYQVWSRLGQRQPALCRLRQADAAAPFTFLTAAERCALQRAYERDLEEARRN